MNSKPSSFGKFLLIRVISQPGRECLLGNKKNPWSLKWTPWLSPWSHLPWPHAPRLSSTSKLKRKNKRYRYTVHHPVTQGRGPSGKKTIKQGTQINIYLLHQRTNLQHRCTSKSLSSFFVFFLFFLIIFCTTEITFIIYNWHHLIFKNMYFCDSIPPVDIPFNTKCIFTKRILLHKSHG